MVTSPGSISTVTGIVSLASVSLFLFTSVWSMVLFSLLFLLLLWGNAGVVELKRGHLPYSLMRDQTNFDHKREGCLQRHLLCPGVC